jgi:hypothetical protein
MGINRKGQFTCHSGMTALPAARWSLPYGSIPEKSGVRLEVVLDEGDWIAGDYFPGMTGSAAVIGVSERGHIRFDFTTQNTNVPITN